MGVETSQGGYMALNSLSIYQSIPKPPAQSIGGVWHSPVLEGEIWRKTF